MPLLSELTGYLNTLAGEDNAGATTRQFTSPEKVLGTVTWTGTTSPSGVVTKLYYYQIMGPFTKVYWKIRASVPGLLVSSVAVPFPSDLPTPKQFSSQTSDSWVYLGDGAILSSATMANNQGSGCGIYKDAAGNLTLRINSGSAALAASFAMASCSYLNA